MERWRIGEGAERQSLFMIRNQESGVTIYRDEGYVYTLGYVALLHHSCPHRCLGGRVVTDTLIRVLAYAITHVFLFPKHHGCLVLYQTACTLVCLVPAQVFGWAGGDRYTNTGACLCYYTGLVTDIVTRVLAYVITLVFLFALHCGCLVLYHTVGAPPAMGPFNALNWVLPMVSTVE